MCIMWRFCLLFLFHFYIVSSDFVWDSVWIGGGGWISGVFQAKDGTIYARTDVGGAYRYDPSHTKWIPLFEFIAPLDEELIGIDSLAVSPHDANIIYTSNGKYHWHWPQDVMKSTDAGNTFQHTYIYKFDNFTQYGGIGSNEAARYFGERLIVHPNPSMNNTVYLGTRTENGLFVTNNGGNTWSKIESLNKLVNWNNTNGIGIIFVEINPFTYNIYVAVNNIGIYQSKDEGKTFEFLSNSPRYPQRAAFNKAQNDGKFIVAASNGLYLFDESTLKWSLISPNHNYRGIDISPDGYLIIAGISAGDGGNGLFYAYYHDIVNNGNYSWNPLYLNFNDETNIKQSVSWRTPHDFGGGFDRIIFDNRYPNTTNNAAVHLIFSDWNAVWFNDDALNISENNNNVWYNNMYGFEETVIEIMVTLPKPSKVSLIEGMADNEGFIHQNITEYPTQKMIYHQQDYGTGSIVGIDFCESDTNIIVCVSGSEQADSANNLTGAISRDQGNTWTIFETHPPRIGEPKTNAIGGHIKISPTDCNHMVWIPYSQTPFVSKDGGKTWTNSSGAPYNEISGDINGWEGGGLHNFANDRINGNYFYFYYYPKNAKYAHFWYSNDGGFTYYQGNGTLPAPNGGQSGYVGAHYVESDWSREGTLCVALTMNGLWCSDDYGDTATKMNGIYLVTMFAFGIDKSNSSKSVLYYYGISESDYDKNENITTSPYMIDSLSGDHIRMLTNSSYLIGDVPQTFAADRQVFGRVYIGTNGRGIYYSTYT